MFWVKKKTWTKLSGFNSKPYIVLHDIIFNFFSIFFSPGILIVLLQWSLTTDIQHMEKIKIKLM